MCTYAQVNCLKWNCVMLKWIAWNRTVFDIEIVLTRNWNVWQLNFVLMLNWIVWNRTVYLYKNGFGIK